MNDNGAPVRSAAANFAAENGSGGRSRPAPRLTLFVELEEAPASYMYGHVP